MLEKKPISMFHLHQLTSHNISILFHNSYIPLFVSVLGFFNTLILIEGCFCCKCYSQCCALFDNELNLVAILQFISNFVA